MRHVANLFLVLHNASVPVTYRGQKQVFCSSGLFTHNVNSFKENF